MELAHKLIRKLRAYGTLVMFSHTIFSLSFGAVAFLAASNGRPRLWTAAWAALAFLSARTGANALNRAVDARIDAKNPRTAGRQIPRGEISVRETVALSAACFALLVVSAAMLNPLCLVLSPLALLMMAFYSYTKRFTGLCHLFLGATCGIAPVGAWLAVTGRFSLPPLLLGAANCLWTAGFDVIYGCQDYDFDRQNGLHSIPVRFGVAGALHISTAFHAAALVCLAAFLLLEPHMGLLFGAGLLAAAALMAVQHTMVSPRRLEGVNVASYSMSQLTSLALLVFGILDIYL